MLVGKGPSRNYGAVPLQGIDDVPGLDQFHALGKTGWFRALAKPVRCIIFRRVAQGDGPGAPATTRRATRQRADCMKELVPWVGFPVSRLATASHNDARAKARLSGCGYRRR